MIYSTKFATELNIKDFILSKVTEWEIYSYYLGYAFLPNKVFNSPFRRDRKPSFGIYHAQDGTLMYKDLGNPNYAGDCFNFVAQLNSIPYKEAILKVYKELITNKIRTLNIKLPIIYKGGTETKLRKQIEFVPKKNLSFQEKKYWKELDVTEEDMSFFKLKAAESVYVNNKLKWESTNLNPIFIYKTFNKIKAYRPFEANSSKKWLSNCSRYDIQGWEQLPKLNNIDTLVITKSMKDIITLRKLGYLAIAPPSESVLIPPEAMKILKEDFGFKKFIVIYDRDDGGMKGARKMFIKYRGEYNITFTFLPKNGPKDVSELRRNYGKKRTLSILKRVLKYDPDEKVSIVSANVSI